VKDLLIKDSIADFWRPDRAFWLIQLIYNYCGPACKMARMSRPFPFLEDFRIASGGLRFNKIEKPLRSGKQPPEKGWRRRPLNS
jgi:hypothetical protein